MLSLLISWGSAMFYAYSIKQRAKLSPGRGKVPATPSEQHLQFCETLDQHGSKQRQHCVLLALPHTAVGWLQSGGRKSGESTKTLLK